MEIRGYTLHEVIGDGRTGRVYRAERTQDGTKVAFRQVKPHLAREPGVPERVVRLAQDCRGLASVVLVPVMDAFDVEGAVCVVEPFVEGRTLKQRLAEGTLPPEDVAELGVEILEGLAELHEAGLVHGDVSPANIFLTSRGARLTGFGVADRTGRRRLARTMFGDPFDAPEVQTSGNTSPSSDVFGLAASLELALKGEQQAVGFALEEEQSGLQRILREGTASHPNLRIKDAVTFRKALLKVLRDAPQAPGAPRSKPAPWGEDAGPGAREDAPKPLSSEERRPRQPSPSRPHKTAATRPELPAWAPRAALAGALGLLAFALLGWLLSLLPDVPPGMVEIPEGSVDLGDPAGDRDERPGLTWTHGRFFVDVREVTVGDYAACVASGGCAEGGDRLAQPQVDPGVAVAGVTWLQASSYCAQRGARLPSENEWEAAARYFGGRFPWGDSEPTCEVAWYGAWPSGPCGAPGLEPAARGVGQAAIDDAEVPVDLAGNLWEYTNSDYEPRRDAGTGELAAAGSGVLKVIKGGAFSTGARDLRSAARMGVELDHWAADVGFRCAQTADE